MEASANEPRVTQYVILQKAQKGAGGPAGGWFTVAGVDEGSEPVEAGSSDAAIKEYLDNRSTLDEADLVGAEFVAVPLRSWRPRKIGGIDEVPAKRQFKLD